MSKAMKDRSRFHVELSLDEAKMLVEALGESLSKTQRPGLGHVVDALALRERLTNNLFYAKQRAEHASRSATAPAPLQSEARSN